MLKPIFTLTALVALAGGCSAVTAQQAVKTQDVSFGEVTGKLPTAWASKGATREFRIGEWTVPGAQGAAPAVLIAFHFGKNGGGGVEDNVKRWMGMVRVADPKQAVRDKIQRQGLVVHTVDLTGTYLEKPFPASQQITERPNYRMLAAMIETTGEGGNGPYYVRLVGPAKTVGAAKAGWDGLLGSLKAP
jgi:hypothetical protein